MIPPFFTLRVIVLSFVWHYHERKELEENMNRRFSFLYNSKGDCVAVRVNRFLYSTTGQYLGWIDHNNIAIAPDHHYFGTIFNASRLYAFENHPPVNAAFSLVWVPLQGRRWKPPARIAAEELPPGARDIETEPNMIPLVEGKVENEI